MVGSVSGAGVKILVIEDEESIRRFLRASLSTHGYAMLEAGSGEIGLALAAEEKPDLIILDLGLPDIDGREVLEQIRTGSRVPIIVLSARGREGDKVTAFEAGADDYLTKPFGMRELLARINAVMRRSEQNEGGAFFEQPYHCGDLKIDFASGRVTLSDRELKLTRTELKLLSSLARHAGKVITHRRLLEEVWGPAYVDELNYLRVFMAGLRRKIEVDSAQPRYLLTEQSVGYRLADD
ncbi:MAG: response regulator transcription factor [Planctomycetia bacterium]|nr:response regulator transcription factor [Planctomycetia bacterium]